MRRSSSDATGGIISVAFESDGSLTVTIRLIAMARSARAQETGVPSLAERTMSASIYLYEGDAAAGLAAVASGSVSLVVTSPRYLDLVDYEAVSRGARLRWRGGTARESLHDYVREHMATVQALADVCAPDATICIEVDYYRDTEGRCLLPLPDLFRDMLAGVGFRIPEHITLARHLAHGRRSGHFIKSQGKPGTLLPDNLTSALII